MSEARAFPHMTAGTGMSPAIMGSAQGLPTPTEALDCQLASASDSPAMAVDRADATPAFAAAKTACVSPLRKAKQKTGNLMLDNSSPLEGTSKPTVLLAPAKGKTKDRIPRNGDSKEEEDAG